MSVEVDGQVVRLSGRCGVGEAESLLAALTAGAARIDLTGCEQLHAAVLQLLMAANVEVTGMPSEFIRQWLLPTLGTRREGPGTPPEF
jgi:hypothetical protein